MWQATLPMVTSGIRSECRLMASVTIVSRCGRRIRSTSIMALGGSDHLKAWPPIPRSGDGGWWQLQDLSITPNRIQGAVKFNGMNGPSFR